MRGSPPSPVSPDHQPLQLGTPEQWQSFLAGFLHELRTPISSSRMLAELLLEASEEELASRERRYCENLSAVLQEIQEQVADAGELMRLAAGPASSPPQPTGLAEAVRRAEESIRVRAWEQGIGVSSFLDPGLSATFPTDPSRLERLLALLLDSGLSQASTEVFLHLDQEGEGIRVCVSSDGVPFPEPTPDRFFDPYDPGALALRQRRGRGLALPLAHQLARSLGAILRLENQRGRPAFLLSLGRPGAAPPAP